MLSFLFLHSSSKQRKMAIMRAALAFTILLLSTNMLVPIANSLPGQAGHGFSASPAEKMLEYKTVNGSHFIQFFSCTSLF
jgi:hypothetical protein